MRKNISIEEILGFIEIVDYKNLPLNSPINTISTDSRNIQEGDIFVALKGQNYDGHQFIDEAAKKGAILSIIEKDWYLSNPDVKFPVLVVPDTLVALGEIANLYRSKFNIPIIAIAGSNGKTTTKDFVAHILSQKFNVLKTEGNLNNQIGVPLTLFGLEDKHQVAVIEIGTNSFGEIGRLCEILEPNYGVITNIGKEHLEAFIDLDGVEMEETTLLAYLLKHNGLAFINCEDERLKKYAKILEKKFTYGTGDENNLIYTISLDAKLKPTITFHYEGFSFSAKLNTPGYSIALACVPAVAVSLNFGLTIEEITDGIQSFTLPRYGTYGRMSVDNYGELIIINDTYNANPSSMKMALETLKNLEPNRNKIAVLGDMLELGEVSLHEHIEILTLALKICNKIFTFGENMKNASEKFNTEKIQHYENKLDIADELYRTIEGNEIILFKASRGMKCEEILIDFLNKIKV
ncbi:MAG: UDP-N-acetylmuramoyl-tripeptide--D-alanyl-D-alanine ligase [Ignavibacteria bacterium]|nr:UDP-N-acetylmuramoyl-tripeptide--D-alanyl-D-alanine ligase [Ignavibacteria bacterium]